MKVEQFGQSSEQPRQSALLRLGYTSPRGGGRGSRRGRGARRGTGITAEYRGQQYYTRGLRGWRGRGAGSFYATGMTNGTAAQAMDTPYFRGLL